jgi:excinuclease ABC subunit C
VGYVSENDYQMDVLHAQLFLSGKDQKVIAELIQKMETASEKLEFEKALKIRDEIALLKSVQEQQIIMKNTVNMNDIDIIAVESLNENACIHMLMIREGRMLGSRQYFPNLSKALVAPEEESYENKNQQLLEAFILQHYAAKQVMNEDKEAEDKEAFVLIPKIILLSESLTHKETLCEILSERAHHLVQIQKPIKGDRLKWMNMALLSAEKALKGRLTHLLDLTPNFEALQDCLQLEAVPERLECFDVSHTLGEATVTSCVVFDVRGPLKSDYRRYNIRLETKGDDYAAMKEALTRHYTRLKLEGGTLPDILFVDGGKGQLSCARAVLEELQVAGLSIVAIAKGEQRKPGLETLYVARNGTALMVKPNALALTVIQRIRDEAHRFAITAHRKKRAQKRVRSVLEDIKGIGKARRNAILKYFGGLQEVLKANREELAKVPGVNQALAQRIYESLHGS